jgi:omega-hydroxy-beta-dihydromenaquinone-9 sulfotransferase
VPRTMVNMACRGENKSIQDPANSINRMLQPNQTRARPRKLATHPLCGADPKTLIRLFTASGGVQWDRLGDLLMIAGSALARMPFNALERHWVELRVESEITQKPPIFILGHWRSGTTHLYNILSKSPKFGYLPPISTGIPWNMLTLGRWLEPLLRKTLPSERFIDNVPVQVDSPQEDEIALANMIDLSFYHGLYFPSRFHEFFNKGVYFQGCAPLEIERWKETFGYFMRKLSILQGGRPILVKNPVYTARASLLKEMYPNAKFIHIHRNPYRVFESMKNFYVNLFHELAFQPYDHLSIPDIVLEHYPRIMDRMIEDTKGMDSSQFIELGYDELDQHPLTSLRKIYEALDLGDFSEDEQVYERYLDSVKPYQKNTYKFSSQSIETVTQHWGRFVHHWGYNVPGKDQ